ncbi:MAG: molecular chaperone DnaJ [Robiginitomaculum sp.]|nr:MAG: molecular chaperone DnaJ [Robiginitomaculum sp.]
MANDPYKVLGVAKTANKDEIRKAYRTLAKKYHPDVCPDDAKAEATFKEASAAFALLNNEEERARYDRGEIDSEGNPKGPQGFPGQGHGFPGGYAPGGFEDISDILSDLFGSQARGGRRQNFAFRGEDIRYTLPVEFLDAVTGTSKQVRMSDGKQLKISIPPGSKDSDLLRLRGQGNAGSGGGPPGDAIVELKVRSHKYFKREGSTIHLDLPISLKEAVEGGKVSVPTPSGTVSLTLPPNTSSGKVLRLKGKGVPSRKGRAGDMLVRLMIVLPEKPDAGLKKCIANWEPEEKDNPRKGLGV